MTRQEAFNTAYLGVIAQGHPSRTAKGCLYRGPNNTKCGIGQLLTDEEARGLDDTGDTGVEGVFKDGLLPSRFVRGDLEFYVALQEAHDEASIGDDEFVDDFKDRMHVVADHYKLEIPNG